MKNRPSRAPMGVLRYEFRVFAPDLRWLGSAVRRRAPLSGYREGRECYLLVVGRDDLNLKIRNDALDPKRLVQVERGVQLWEPDDRIPLPAARSTLRESLGPVIDADDDPGDDGRLTADALAQHFAGPSDRRGLARVFKQRWSFRVGDCGVEVVEILANGALLASAAVESTDPEAVLRVRDDLGLDGWENVSYVLALWRLLGWSPAPDGY